MTHPAEEPLLVALDYPGYRAEARLAELRLPEHGLGVHELLSRPLPCATRGTDYAAHLLASHPLPGGPGTREVAAVAAYCASAPLAFEVAARLGADAGTPPLLILFDAEPDTRRPALDSYREAVAQFGVSPSEPPEPGLLDRAPEAFVESLVGRLRGHAVSALHTLGSDQEEAVASAAQMADAYADWLRHLVAAHHSAVTDWTGDVLHIVSADGAPSPFPHGTRSVRRTQIDCARKDLLRCAETRSAVLAAVER
ncbi:hypothetical protein EST92_10455 [Streptomyces sp. TM32]|uniref:hypothetical protein n=1 Tax=Streptomyces sp. TM32 TaxID=1652669 RepID=UPI001012C641|nr:hypothetical protein [Streptomyces sp. TM32]RXS84650.1 hypothetical protein EST92_10455 [Streptomyces sp. TM32]